MRLPFVLAIFLAASTASPALAQVTLFADRTIPEELNVLGIRNLDPAGCEVGSARCSEIGVHAEIVRVHYKGYANVPEGLIVKDLKRGYELFVHIPADRIVDEIGTADLGWFSTWLRTGRQIYIIGSTGGSAGDISPDAIYDAAIFEPFED